jgi:hypothetical protein
MLRIWALLLAAVLTGVPAAWAEPSGEMEPNVIRQELEGLRTRYTDQHPDVILLQRKLEKAEEMKRQRESRKRKQRGQPGAQPDPREDADRPPAGLPHSTDSND